MFYPMFTAGYTKMRLPNLVEHDTLHEVSQQSMSWIPLLNIKCHPDTQVYKYTTAIHSSIH